MSILFRLLSIPLAICLLNACSSPNGASSSNSNTPDSLEITRQVSDFLDSMHLDAGNADYNAYFNRYDEEAAFVGTDAKEYWEIDSFKIWAKPFFDRGKAWNFTCLERKIHWNETGNLVWFYETLSTQMKLCRGSGVLERKNNQWKIKQYVLSASIPNEVMDEVVKLKTPYEEQN